MGYSMKGKEKLVISLIAVMLVVVILCLTIGIVLVSNMARIKSNMHVSYDGKNVECTIVATGQIYTLEDEVVGEEIVSTPDKIEIKATDIGTSLTGSMEFEDEIFLQSNEYIIFTFSITNDANITGTSKDISVEYELIDVPVNFEVTIQNNAESIAAGETKTVTLKFEIDNETIDATFHGDLKLHIFQI